MVGIGSHVYVYRCKNSCQNSYSSSHGKAILNSLQMASMTITNNSGLTAEPWCIVHANFYLKTGNVTINCSDNCFCTCVRRHKCRYQPIFISEVTYCPSYHFSRNPLKSFFQIHKAKIEFFSFLTLKFSCICLTITSSSAIAERPRNARSTSNRKPVNFRSKGYILH